jgi:hypothetical protein
MMLYAVAFIVGAWVGMAVMALLIAGKDGNNG